MRRTTSITTLGAGLAISGLLLSPAPLLAQESPQGQMGHMGMQGMMGKEQSHGMMAEMQQRHEQMEKMHQEMTQELQKQVTALREHTKAMEGMSDEKQVLTEMKKHQHMTDALLGTMLEQREKMHAQMQRRHEQMRSRMGKEQPMEGSGTEQSEEHEQHHDK
jgi:hypothetical protein